MILKKQRVFKNMNSPEILSTFILKTYVSFIDVESFALTAFWSMFQILIMWYNDMKSILMVTPKFNKIDIKYKLIMPILIISFFIWLFKKKSFYVNLFKWPQFNFNYDIIKKLWKSNYIYILLQILQTHSYI